MTVATLFDTPLLLLLLPIVAFLYASVGHGGASGYLALMSLFSFPMTFMKPTALVLNILVSAVSFYFYYKERKMNWSLFYPFALTSIPFSFLGGFLTINAFYYKIILATVLVFAVLRLLGFLGKEKNRSKTHIHSVSVVHWCNHWFFVGLVGNRRRNYFKPCFVTPAMGHYQTNRSGFGLVYFGKFYFGFNRICYQRWYISRSFLTINCDCFCRRIARGFFWK